jgi:putative NADH-flavin reductase
MMGARLSIKFRRTFAVVFASALFLSACVSQSGRVESTAYVADGTVPKKEITIALLGGTGMVGGFVLQQALAEGYDVRALARTPGKLDAFKDHITIVQGDAQDRATIEKLVRGTQVVISALGPVKADGDAASMISAKASDHVIRSMTEFGVQRYVVVSGAAVEVPGDDRNMTGWLLRQLASLVLHDTLKDKQLEYQLLADSSLEWTLVRCPIIDPKPFVKEAVASLNTPKSFRLRAGELARFAIEQINSDEFVRRAPFLSSL